MSASPVLSASIAALIISACSKFDQNNAGRPADAIEKMQQAAQNPVAAAAPKKDTVAASSLPQADKATAEGKYTPVNSGTQLAYLYYAISGMPVNYEKLPELFRRTIGRRVMSSRKKKSLTA